MFGVKGGFQMVQGAWLGWRAAIWISGDLLLCVIISTDMLTENTSYHISHKLD